MKHILAILSALVLCTACWDLIVPPTPPTPSPSPSPSPTASPTPEPKVLTICLSEEPDSLYLYGTDSLVAHHVWEAIYDGPVDNRDYTQQPVILAELPNLADGTAAVYTTPVQAGDRVLAASGGVMELAPGVIVESAESDRVVFDGTTVPMKQMVVTFTLRSDVRWSDGQLLSPQDSVYSFQLAADPATPADKYLVDRTVAYRAIDERQVVWRSVPGYLDPAYALNFWHPLPRHRWENLSAAELLSAEVSARKPLGWGAFAIREWIPGERLVVERNQSYFRARDGLPRVDEVIFRFASRPGELVDELLSGHCDVVTHEASETIRDGVEDPAVPPTMNSIVTEDAALELLTFGISPVPGYERPDFFEDTRVRRGIARCIDRQAVAAAASIDGVHVPFSYLPAQHPLYAREKLATWSYDPEAGQLLLAQAGWYDEDGDGLREAHGVPGVADGVTFQVMYHITQDPLRARTAELIQSDLRTCGIDADIQTLPAATFFASGPDGVLFGRRFDLAQFSWQATGTPPCDLLLSSQIPDERDWSKPNVAGFIDGEYDRLCLEALQALPNDPRYVVAHMEAQRIFSEQLPLLPLFRYQRVTLAHNSVTGLISSPGQRSELWNVEELDVQR